MLIFLDTIKSYVIEVLVVLYLFFGSLPYGDAIDLKFTCETPSGVYEYEVGDKVNIHATLENVGRPFKAEVFTDNFLRVSVYTTVDGVEIYPLEVPSSGSEIYDYYSSYLVKNGDILEKDFRFTVREGAPAGAYDVKISSDFGDEEIFEDMIIIK